MTKPRTGIDQQELEAAIARLTECGDTDCERVYYRNPFEVAREEWRKMAFGSVHTGMRPEVKANWPTAQLLEIPPPMTNADIVDMEAFKEAQADWSKQLTAAIQAGNSQPPAGPRRPDPAGFAPISTASSTGSILGGRHSKKANTGVRSKKPAEAGD